MKNILIVDDNTETRNIISSRLNNINEFRILSTDSAKTAAKLIRTQPIDLMITELVLPDINGFKLLSYAKKYSPDTHAIAISNFSASQTIEKLKAIDDYSYLNKPLKIDSLVDIIFKKLNIQPASSIHGISLVAFLQLINQEQKTCTLSLHTNENQGVIHCLSGEMIGARTEDLNGIQAFRKIMEWGSPHIKIKEGCQHVERQINVPLMHLLMESYQLIDESGIDCSEILPPLNSANPVGETETIHSNPEFYHEDINFKKLDALLSETPGISDYEIYYNNMVLNKPPSSCRLFDVQPLDFFSIGNTISNIVGGNLKYSKINPPVGSIGCH